VRSDVTIGNFVCEEDNPTPLVTYLFNVDIAGNNTPALTVVHLYRFDSTGFIAANFSSTTNIPAIRVLSAQSETSGFYPVAPAIPSPGHAWPNPAVMADLPYVVCVCLRIYLPFSAGGNTFGVTITDFNGVSVLLPADPPFVDLHPGETITFATAAPGSWQVYGGTSS
jgi:hypothetical protein